MVAGALSNYRQGCIRAQVAPVHKPLAGASQLAKNGMDSWIGGDGSCMWHKDSPFGRFMRRSYAMACRKFGDNDLVPLHEKNGVYTFDFWVLETPTDQLMKQIAVMTKKQKTLAAPGDTQEEGFQGQEQP